jgi:hypothetical protein
LMAGGTLEELKQHLQANGQGIEHEVKP